jgi:hypothetical protein
LRPQHMMFTPGLLTGLIVGAALLIPNPSSPLFFSRTSQKPDVTSTIQNAQRTVQISLDTDANILIEKSDGKRIGFDFTTKTLVNEIPEARSIDREMSSTFVLPYDKTGKPYKVAIAGKPGSAPAAILSMAGPGFIAGVRGLKLSVGQIQRMSISSDGSGISLMTNEDGATPQLFFTTQSGRDKPSYRFEVASPSASRGKTISVNLDLTNGRLYFKSEDTRKIGFSVMMRRTNPGGGRDTYNHQDVSFARSNSYALNFAPWDGKGDACFYEKCAGCDESHCTNLKNEY